MLELRRPTEALRGSLLAALYITLVVGCGEKGSPSERAECENPRSPVPGTDTGIELCGEDGVFPAYAHRIRAVACPNGLPRDMTWGAGGDTAGVEGVCQSDGDCPGEYGYCDVPDESDQPGCFSGCVQDSDCQADELCECGATIGVCRAAQCRSDADCKDDARCLSVSVLEGGCVGLSVRYACESAADECTSKSDCDSGTCALAETGQRVCVDLYCN